MRTLGTILSGLLLAAWVAYLSWPVSAEGPAPQATQVPVKRIASTVEPSKKMAEPQAIVDAPSPIDVLEPAV
jgi:hypothetical protein